MDSDHPLRILFVEDVPADAELAQRALRTAGLAFTSLCIETKDAFLAALAEFQPDLIISDYALPEFDGLQALQLSLAHDATLPFIILTSRDEETAVACMKAGATDYVIKQRMTRLPFAVREALEQKKARLATEEAERALRENEAKQSAMIANIADVIAIIDRAGINRYKSPNIEKWFGWRPEEVVGVSTWENVHPEDLERTQKFLGTLLGEPNATGTAECRYRCKDGSYKWIEFTAVNLLHSPEIGGMLLNYHDISARKQLERALAVERDLLEQRVDERTRALGVANDRLQELDRLKSKFVSDVSHELRTPVTSLMLYLSLLEHGKPEKHAHYLASSIEQASRMKQLIEDILDLSRLERETAVLVFEPVDLNAVLERVIITHQPRAEAAGLTLTFEAGGGSPLVLGEINQLLQVATNLITNAINYTRAGEVRVASGIENGHGWLEVRDTGMGIDPVDLPHLFDRFYRGQRAVQAGVRGTGLGLGIVKDIVDRHGGRIEVASQVGVGSTFRVWLPIAR